MESVQSMGDKVINLPAGDGQNELEAVGSDAVQDQMLESIKSSDRSYEDEEEDYVSDEDIEDNLHNQKLTDQSSLGYSSGMLGGLVNIPEDQELDQDLLQMNHFKVSATSSGPAFLDGNSPVRSNPLGPSMEVMNLELETALQDAEQEILSLKEKLKSKELQLEQVQIALLTYEEELSNQFHSNQNQEEQENSSDKANADVFQRTMAKSLQLLEEQKNRELKELHGRLDELQEVIFRLQEERDLMARDMSEMQNSYEQQLDRMSRSTQQLEVQQDASEFEIGELLKRFKSAERDRDALEMKLYEAMNQINTLQGDDAVQCLYNQVQELQQANSRLTEDLKRALRVQGRTTLFRNNNNQQEQESRNKGGVHKEIRPSTPSSLTTSSTMRPVTPPVGQTRSQTPFGDGAVLYGTVARQLIELHETTDNLMQMNNNVQQQLALCQAIDANAERSISSAFRALRTVGAESPISDVSTQSTMTEPIQEGTQSLHDLQEFVREMRDNLRKAVSTLETLNQEKAHLHSRIRILEACLKASGADQFVTTHQQQQQQSAAQPPIYGGVDHAHSMEPPACSSYEEAMEALKQAYKVIGSNQMDVTRMEKEKGELVQMVEQLENEAEDMRRDRENSSRRHTYTCEESSNHSPGPTRPGSVNSLDSDAIHVAEEMSKKLVRIQQEKEDLEDKLSESKLENVQLKEVRLQLENQIQLLLQSQKRSNSGGLQSLVRSGSWGRRRQATQ